MRKRTKAREMALQYLYQMDLTHGDLKKSGTSAMDDILVRADVENDQDLVKEYAKRILQEVVSHGRALDHAIEKCSDNWTLDRMAVVDRNILRIGACEIIYFDDIPSKVAINEAIELAKKFGDAESSKFVNGILDKVTKEAPSES